MFATSGNSNGHQKRVNQVEGTTLITRQRNANQHALQIMSDPKDDWKPIAITLPVRYWITVLGLTENFVQQKVTPQIDALRKRGSKLDDIPDEMKTVLMGPVFARGAIIDALL